MKAPIIIDLDIADVYAIVKADFERRYSQLELTGVCVSSFRTPVFRIEDGMLIDPVRHQIHPERCRLQHDPQ